MPFSKDMPKKGHVLVVDDEYPVAKSISELIEYLGYSSEYETNATKLDGRLSEKPDIDIILLDIHLDCMNGMDLIPGIKQRNKYVQVIMFSSESRIQIGVECMRRGAFDYLTKPFDENAFLEKAAGAIERKKALQLNDLYLGILFHDLKNPLQGIMSGVELLRVMGPDSANEEARQSAFSLAEDAIATILRMVDNVVGIARFESGGFCTNNSVFTLSEAVESALKIFLNTASRAGHPPIAIDYNTVKDRTVVADRDLLGRVLVNIVSNSLRYAAEKSPVTISFNEEEGNYLHCAVTNTGSFIEESARDAIFNKFSSVHIVPNVSTIKNFGLGLTFGKMAVEALEGRIWITCDKAVPTTTFHFTLKNFDPGPGTGEQKA